MSDVNFPSTKDVYDTLKNTTKLVEDRNALIKFYFQEDVYKDFLLAERLQDLAAVERRDDSTRQRSVNLDKKEVVQQATYFKRFSNFLNPGDLPMGDLDPLPPIEFDEDVNLDGALDIDGKVEEEKKKKSEGGSWAGLIANLITGKTGGGGGATTKAAYGAAVTPTSPMIPSVSQIGGAISQNIFNSPGDSAKTQSLAESGFEEGVQKNIEDRFDEDLGIDPKLKSALAKAMALPLQVVAGGLMKLMAMMPISSNEQRQDLNKSIAFISNAFGVPASSLENVPSDSRVLQQRGSKESAATPAAPRPSSGASSGPTASQGPGKPGGGGFQWNKPETWGKLFTGGPVESGEMRTGLPVSISNSFGHQNVSNMLANSTNMSSSTISSNSLSSKEEKNTSDYTNSSMASNTFTSVLNNLLGGQSHITASMSGGNAHIHAVLANNVNSNVQENRADLLELTNNLETQIAERRKEQTTTMAQTFATPSMGMPASSPSPAAADSLNSGSHFAGSEEEDSPFFSLYASTNQYA